MTSGSHDHSNKYLSVAWRTVCTSQADRPRYLTFAPRHRRQQVRRRRRRPFTGAGDTPRKGKKTGERKELTTNPFTRSVRAEDDRRGGSTVEQSFKHLQWQPAVARDDSGRKKPV